MPPARETQAGVVTGLFAKVRTAGTITPWRPMEVAFWALAGSVFFVFPSHLLLANQILITALFALSLDLILGYAGILSLGHAAFFGIGAYTAGLLAVHGWSEPISGLLVAGLVATLIGLAVSFLVLRGEDLARLMVTLGIGYLFYEAANKASGITGGSDGLSGVAMGKLLGLFEFDIAGQTAFVYSFVVLLIVFVCVRALVQSPFGLTLRGIRENPRRMPAIGTPVFRRLVAVFTLGAGLAGLAGALLAQTTQFVGLETLAFHRSAEVLIMLILGGVGRLYGGLIGAAIFLVAHDVLSSMNPVYWQFWLGMLLMAAVFLFRGGILSGLDRLRARTLGRGT